MYGCGHSTPYGSLGNLWRLSCSNVFNVAQASFSVQNAVLLQAKFYRYRNFILICHYAGPQIHQLSEPCEEVRQSYPSAITL